MRKLDLIWLRSYIANMFGTRIVVHKRANLKCLFLLLITLACGPAIWTSTQKLVRSIDSQTPCKSC